MTQLETLRRQQAVDVHSATSAMELVREFLDQAQLVADEGNGRNNRYRALLLLAAQVALQMDFSLRTIEQELPLHFQRLLVDGIVDFAEQPPAQRSEFARNVKLRPLEARVLHQRWTLRALVSQSQNGYLTCSNSNDGEDIGVSYQVALGDLMSSHLQIAQSIQATLVEDDEEQALPLQTQLDAYYDLGVYFFSFSGYERAYGCFSRAAELLEEYNTDNMSDRADNQVVTLSKEDRDSLEGYLKACEAVLETKSTTDGLASAQTPKAYVELAWESRDWEKVIELLQNDMVAPELTRFAPGYRAALEQQALRLMRANCDSKAGANDEEGQLSAPVVRLFYKRLTIANTIRFHLLTDEDAASDILDLESCVCSCARLLQGEIFQSAANADGHNDAHVFAELARFVLTLAAYLLEHLSSGDPAKFRLKQFVARLIEMVPTMVAVAGVGKLLAQCGYSPHELAGDTSATSQSHALERLLEAERDIRGATKQQCDHFRVIADLSRVYEFENAKDKAEFVASVREQVDSLVASGQTRPGHDEDTYAWRSFVTFCLLHSCWDLLEQGKALWKDSAKAQSELNFALACGAMVRFLSTLSASPLPGLHGGDSDNANQTPGKMEFSITASNRLVAEILSKRRHIVGDASTSGSSHNGGNSDVKQGDSANEMVDLPVWVVETLVCISAGLLHRAHMRNACDYRVSFDLTPYGDLAFLQAFAPEDGKVDSVKSEPGSESTLTSAQFLRSYQSDLVALLLAGLDALVRRCGREPRWHCARADLALNPIVRQKLSATSGASTCSTRPARPDLI